MRTSVVISASPSRSPRLSASGGITARITGLDRVHLVSSAATPLGDDEISIAVRVQAGGRLLLRTTAATLVYPGRTPATSRTFWDIEVGAGGVLSIDPLPTIVAAGARHVSNMTVRLTHSSELCLGERVQLGRSAESGGRWSGGISVDIDDLPVLRHRINLGNNMIHDVNIAAEEIAPPLRWPAGRALLSEFRYPGRAVGHVLTDGMALCAPLAGGGELLTAQAETLSAAEILARRLIADAAVPNRTAASAMLA